MADASPAGGYLGFYCSHAYAHTNTDAAILPDMLKGLDMIIWEAFGRLGLEASVKPVMNVDNFYYEEDDRELMVIGNERALRINEGSMRMEDYYYMDKELAEWRGGETLKSKEVHWLTKPTHKQVQMAYIAVSITLKSISSLRNEHGANLNIPKSMATRRACRPSIPIVQSLPRSSPAMLDRVE